VILTEVIFCPWEANFYKERCSPYCDAAKIQGVRDARCCAVVTHSPYRDSCVSKYLCLYWYYHDGLSDARYLGLQLPSCKLWVIRSLDFCS